MRDVSNMICEAWPAYRRGYALHELMPKIAALANVSIQSPGSLHKGTPINQPTRFRVRRSDGICVGWDAISVSGASKKRGFHPSLRRSVDGVVYIGASRPSHGAIYRGAHKSKCLQDHLQHLRILVDTQGLFGSYFSINLKSAGLCREMKHQVQILAGEVLVNDQDFYCRSRGMLCSVMGPASR